MKEFAELLAAGYNVSFESISAKQAYVRVVKLSTRTHYTKLIDLRTMDENFANKLFNDATSEIREAEKDKVSSENL